MSYIKSKRSRKNAVQSGQNTSGAEVSRPRGAWFAEVTAQKVIDSLARGRMPWLHADASLSQGLPAGSSGKPYIGANRVCLMIAAAQNGYFDPRWNTLTATNQRGERIKTGAKSSVIERWIWFGRKKEVDPVTQQEKVVQVKLPAPRVQYFNLFNAQQIRDALPYERPEAVDVADLISRLESGSRAMIGRAPVAGYDPVTRKISMPMRTASLTPEVYLDSLVAQMVHHEMECLGEEGRIKDEVRMSEARQWLRIELACAMFSHQYGIPHAPSASEEFFGDWVTMLKANPRELLHAGRDAGLAFERVSLALNPEASVVAEPDDEFDATSVGAPSVMEEIEAMGGIDLDAIEFDELAPDDVEIELTGQRSGHGFRM